MVALRLSECLTQNAAGDHEILKIFFRGFDTDYDAVLTLNEYRISPLGNRNYPWQDRLVDESGDGQISYGEYTFDAVDLFRLQRRLYFHRMDLDFDGALVNQRMFVYLHSSHHRCEMPRSESRRNHHQGCGF